MNMETWLVKTQTVLFYICNITANCEFSKLMISIIVLFPISLQCSLSPIWSSFFLRVLYTGWVGMTRLIKLKDIYKVTNIKIIYMRTCKKKIS